MNVREMHLAIRQGVDKINSLQADMLLNEEIDIELNKSMFKFVNTKYGRNNIYRQGFEQSQKRIDDLRTLVTEFEGSVSYKGTCLNDFFIDQFKLPKDYMYLVNQKSTIYSNDCEPITFNLNNVAPLSYFILPLEYLYIDFETNNPVIQTQNFSDPINTTGGFVRQIYMMADLDNGQLGSVSILNGPINAAGGIAPYNYPQDLESLRSDLLDSSNWETGFEIYWEEFGDINAPGSFIITVDTNTYDWFNWDQSETNAVSGTNEITQLIGLHNPVATSAQDSWPKVNGQFTDNYAAAKRISDGTVSRSFAFNKFVQQDDIFKLLTDPFNTTKFSSPLTTIMGDYINIYTSDIFIIDKVKITYIRKPREISLSLDVSCELPVHTHREIVDMTISSILEGINDPRYATHQKEVLKNE
tara:strand:+ start:128 stop:1369 length:1242 start_codon:yes stop_codon:yes gene_type:complete